MIQTKNFATHELLAAQCCTARRGPGEFPKVLGLGRLGFKPFLSEPWPAGCQKQDWCIPIFVNLPKLSSLRAFGTFKTPSTPSLQTSSPPGDTPPRPQSSLTIPREIPGWRLLQYAAAKPLFPTLSPPPSPPPPFPPPHSSSSKEAVPQGRRNSVQNSAK